MAGGWGAGAGVGGAPVVGAEEVGPPEQFDLLDWWRRCIPAGDFSGGQWWTRSGVWLECMCAAVVRAWVCACMGVRVCVWGGVCVNGVCGSVDGGCGRCGPVASSKFSAVSKIIFSPQANRIISWPKNACRTGSTVGTGVSTAVHRSACDGLFPWRRQVIAF